MKRIVTTYDMMISSPGDTGKEVEAIFESIVEFNRRKANQEDSASMVRIIRWNTDVFLKSDISPQESINEQIVASCDFAVVIFRHRLGTPVGNDESGTAQEIRLLRAQKKQLFIFYLEEKSKTALLRGKNAAEMKKIEQQYSALQKYIGKLKKAHIPLHPYTDTADLKQKFLNQLSMFDLLQNVPDLQAANSLGICSITVGSADSRKLRQKIENAKHIKIFTTTGHALFHAYTDEFSRMLRNNGTLQVLLPNPESDFLKDIDLLEERKKENPISREFGATIENLQRIWSEATRTPCNTLGKIRIGCARTMLRQTEIICIDKEHEDDNDDKLIWCWVTVTMPPKRASGKSLSIECQTSKKQDNSLADLTNENFNRSWEKSNAVIELASDTNIPYFYMEKAHAAAFWAQKVETAKKFMDKVRDDETRSGVLIEVAAQHPLTADGAPDTEFAKRLEMGYELYCKSRKQNIRCKLYVPGSLHMHNGIKDSISLSEAGKKYLMEKGVASKDIYGEEQNLKYRKQDGVYNSADECFVSSMIFKDEGFSELFCVCSPVQSVRKVAHYLAFGVFPSIFTCPAPILFHDYVYEMFTALPHVLYEDPYLDPEKSELAKNHRIDRKPGFADTQDNSE